MAVRPDQDSPASSKKPDPGTGMEKGKMKQLLAKSKRSPVNCATAMSADASVGLLLMHVTRKPKVLVKDLMKTIPDLKNPRWGTAEVDLDADPKLVTFNLNKPLPKLDRMLRKTLKGTGYSKVKIPEPGEPSS